LNEDFVFVFGRTDSGVVEIVPQIRILCFLDFLVETLPAVPGFVEGCLVVDASSFAVNVPQEHKFVLLLAVAAVDLLVD
jgi:hypothetical protein